MENLEQIAKNKIKTISIAFFISITIIEFNIITFRTILNNNYERLPNLFGFPFACKTSVPWVNSFEQTVYVKGLLLNLTICFLISYIIICILNKIITNKIFKKVCAIFIFIFGILSIISFAFNPFEEKTFYFEHDFDLKNSKSEIEFFASTNQK